MKHGLDTEKQVFFYEQEFYVLSNFSSFGIRWEGKFYATVEHAYHAEKFEDENIKEAIRNCTSAHDAFKFANENKAHYKKGWDEIKFKVMRSMLIKKVEQHKYVAKKLKETGSRELIENSWRDNVWGWGENRNGQNMLGQLWMEVREVLFAIDKAEII